MDISKILSLIEGNKTYNNCICKIKDCEEKGKIYWNEEKGDFIHIRIDDCVICSNGIKKCDCLLFFQEITEQTAVMMLIEVKKNNYTAEEIKCKLENCIEKIFDDLSLSYNDILVIPVIVAKKNSIDKRLFSKQIINKRGIKQRISYIKWGEDVTNSYINQ